MKNVFETERLRLRQLDMDDVDFIIELLNSPGWLTFIGDRNVRTQEEAIAYLSNGPMKSYEENGFGLSLVELKETKEKIGMCGILKRQTLETPDIGFAFLPAFQGKGYAYEIASKTLEFAHNEWHIQKISAIVKPDNVKSIALLEKIGMHSRDHIRLPGADEDLLLYTT